MVKEKVLSGKYKDCSIVYDHIRSANGEDIYFNSFSVMEFKPADQSKADYWSNSSLRVDGTTSADMEKDRRLISVNWRNGESSLLQVNTKTFNRLMEAMFGRVPQEYAEVEKSVEQKSHKKAVFMVILLIGICAVLKLYLF